MVWLHVATLPPNYWISGNAARAAAGPVIASAGLGRHWQAATQVGPFEVPNALSHARPGTFAADEVLVVQHAPARCWPGWRAENTYNPR